MADTMRGVYTNLTEIRRNVFSSVAKIAYEMAEDDEKTTRRKLRDLPYDIIPGDVATYRESVFLERAIVEQRIASVPETYYQPPLVNVIVIGLFMMMGVFIASSDDMVGIAAGVAAVLGVVAFIGGLLNLFVGVVGLNASKRNDKNTLAFVLGVISVIYGIYSIVSAISTGDGGSIANAFVGIILPALYLYGVIQTRKGIA